MPTTIETAVNDDENRLTTHIICMELTWCSLKILLCQLDVKLSATMYTTMRRMPTACVPRTGASLASFNLNSTTPPVTQIATTYSTALYFFPLTTYPIIITGTILHAFASTWVGKETNLSASYWHAEEMMFDTEQ
eukprot:CAMPEP_0182798436 /NCGR_PEP_ID=MMETSP0006_2-20121128/1348_1 /TAXON_ID=97485 /ORGANISM="Prymnesium parvum, Strain Texoma1" /LENGTH=134 /DNA_ID=CAMNT_0024923551 /DNA_START=138 /DNA_END=539 /DNA_ORIENTATION=-